MARSIGKQRRATRRWQNSLPMLPAFVLAAGFWFGAVWLIFALQSARCPAGTFYSDSPAPQHVFVFLSLLVPSLVLLTLVYAYGATILRGRQMVAAGETSRRNASRTASALRHHLKLLIILVTAALPLSVAFALCQFCLMPSGILFQASPWSGFHEYGWQDVASVTADCSRGSRGAWNAGYVLTMRDGASFDIMGSQFAAARALPAVAQALHGLDVAFDATRVSRNCGAAGVALLRQPP